MIDIRIPISYLYHADQYYNFRLNLTTEDYFLLFMYGFPLEINNVLEASIITFMSFNAVIIIMYLPVEAAMCKFMTLDVPSIDAIETLTTFGESLMDYI